MITTKLTNEENFPVVLMTLYSVHKLCGESRTYQVLLVSKKKIGGNHAFFRDNKASIWGKTPHIALCFTTF